MRKQIEKALAECGLEARWLAPHQYYFRKTPENLRRLICFAQSFKAVIRTPLWPKTPTFIVSRDDDSLEVVFVWKEGVTLPPVARRRPTPLEFGDLLGIAQDNLQHTALRGPRKGTRRLAERERLG